MKIFLYLKKCMNCYYFLSCECMKTWKIVTLIARSCLAAASFDFVSKNHKKTVNLLVLPDICLATKNTEILAVGLSPRWL